MVILDRSATTMEASHGVIIATAHLYNAVKETGCLPLDLKWKDMEYYIHELGNDSVFKVARPVKANIWNVSSACETSAQNYSLSTKSSTPSRNWLKARIGMSASKVLLTLHLSLQHN